MRWWRGVVACLFIGALATVATAWVPSFTGLKTKGQLTSSVRHALVDGRMTIGTGWARHVVMVFVDRPFGSFEVVFDSGWPLHSMRYVLENGQPAEGLRGGAAVPGASWPDPTYHRIPLGVIWPGFLFNTAIFGGGAWLVMGTTRGVRRLLRRRHGMFAQCGYDAAGLPACPECGT